MIKLSDLWIGDRPEPVRPEDVLQLVRDTLARVAYKPGWTFGAGRCHCSTVCNDAMISITALLQNSTRPEQVVAPLYSPGRMIDVYEGFGLRTHVDVRPGGWYQPGHQVLPVTGRFLLPAVVATSARAERAERMVLEFLKVKITELEEHERDEWFRFDGILVDDPHAPKVTIRKAGR